jgi:membrane fusion protein (multidrug efflux system)
MAKALHPHDDHVRARRLAPAAQQHPATASSAALEPPASGRRRSPKRWLCVSLTMVLLGLGLPYGWHLWQYYQTHVSTDDAYVVGTIVPVSARVSGTVLAVQVDEHQQVEAGQLLAQLDPRDFEMQVQQAEAAVAVAASRLQQAELDVLREQQSTASETAQTSATLQAVQSALLAAQYTVDEAQARLGSRQAAVAVARAEVDMQVARYDMTRTAFVRLQQLLADGVVAQQQFDEAASALRGTEAAWRVSQENWTQAQHEAEQAQSELRRQLQAVRQARAQVVAAQARLTGAQAQQQNVAIKEAQVQVTGALLKQQQAALAQARLALAYTTIRAPAAGMVAKKRLEVGQVLKAGQPLLAIVPLTDVWVEANFKETQLRHMRPGQPATLHVDAYPGAMLRGTVASFSPGTGSIFSLLPPENATGNFVKVVQRLPVKIAVQATSLDGLVLRPGMSVLATVQTR